MHTCGGIQYGYSGIIFVFIKLYACNMSTLIVCFKGILIYYCMHLEFLDHNHYMYIYYTVWNSIRIGDPSSEKNIYLLFPHFHSLVQLGAAWQTQLLER